MHVTSGITYIAIDQESTFATNEEITEIGLSILHVDQAMVNTIKSMNNFATLPAGARTIHIRVKEKLRYIAPPFAKKFRRGNCFQYGNSEILPLAEIDERLAHILAEEKAKCSNIVFVGHAMENELKSFNKNSLHAFDGYLEKPPALDTQELYRHGNDCNINGPQPGLEALVEQVLNASTQMLHNAGNDAAATLKLFVKKLSLAFNRLSSAGPSRASG
jgi:hypothetical protein